MSAQVVELGSGGGARVVVTDAGAPLIVLLPAIAGINPYIEAVQQELVDEGFTVAAIDYWARAGEVPDMSSVDKIMAAVAAVRDPDVLADMASVTASIDAPACVALGFCIGGSQAMLAAANVEAVGSAVSFYGLLRYQETSEAKPESPIDAAQRLERPFLGHWGDSDHLVPEADVHDLRKALQGKPAEVYLYPGAGHAFHERFRPEAYRPVAAADAWARTKTFLRWHLVNQG